MGEPAPALKSATTVIGPQQGPQMAFATCEADIAIFGGGAGGGKTFALLYEAGKWSHVPGYTGVIFRRTSPMLTGPGGIWEKSREIFRPTGGRSRGGNTLDWRWDSGARIQFRHMQLEEDRFAHQGGEYAFVGFDELTHFTESQFWYLFGRLRSTCGVRPHLRATCNPDPDSFVYDLIRWWIGDDGYPIPERSGVLRWFLRINGELHWFDTPEEARAAHPNENPKSLTFIRSLIDDNPALLEADPDALSKIQANDRVERARLEKGNWHARASAGTFFPRNAFRVADRPPSEPIRAIRAWDKASTKPSERNRDPDWTRGVRVWLCEGGELWIDDVESLQDGPAEVLGLMHEVAETDGVSVTIGLWQDTGGAGKTDTETTLAVLGKWTVEVVESGSAETVGMARSGHRSGRAKRAWARVWSKRQQDGGVWVKRGQPWTETLLDECDSFPDGTHDDIVDAISLAVQVLEREQGTSLLEAMAAVRLR